MATSNEHRRVTKRSPNACSRCRRQKIKCSGQQPCSNCGKRNLDCIFDDRDNKVLVTQGYLSDLQAKVARLQQRSCKVSNVPGASLSDHDVRDQAERSFSHEEQPQLVDSSSNVGTRENTPDRDRTHHETVDMTNPLTTTPSKFMSSSTGRSFYLGTSSNWSFHGQVLGMVYAHMHKSPLPAADLLFDGSAYDLPWDGTRTLPGSNTPTIPSVDYAIFMVNAVKFHCAQMLHLYDEEEFMTNFYQFYSDVNKSAWKRSLWYIQFLMIIAFGKTFVQLKHQAPYPPGAEFFTHAIQLLPDTNRMCQEPAIAAEILCCIALYLQALDSRNAAHVTMGQAMRLALVQGMHTDMPIANLGRPLVQRCRKIWWTIYILDRHMTSLMGLPQSIRDEDITCPLPEFIESPQRTAALNMQIKLAHVHTGIASTVYGSQGRLRKKFVVSIKAVLDKLAHVAEELRSSFPLHVDELGGISRLPAHSHLYYYQTVVVVTRPLLFCCMKKVFEVPREVESLISSRKLRQLLLITLEASQKILSILESLQEQGLLETFLPWDLDCLSVSTIILLVARFVDKTLLDDRVPWLNKAFELLDTMINGGNRIADFRKRELHHLEEMLTEYSFTQENPPNASIHDQQSAPGLPYSDSTHCARGLMASPGGMPLYSGFSDGSSGFGDDLSAEQILAVTESMDIENTDWLSFTVMDNFHTVNPPVI